jgi:hypothetical protein
MARMGHDSEHAAIIYQHQARGADTVITRAIDAHAGAAMMAVLPVGWRRSANGTLMARSVLWRLRVGRGWMWYMPLIWGSTLERVTRIELALSAWEADVLPLNYTREGLRTDPPSLELPRGRDLPDIVPDAAGDT